MTKTSVLFDTNIWIYYFDIDSSFYKLSNKVVKKSILNNDTIYISTQILREFVSVVTHKKKIEHPLSITKAIEKINYLLEYFSIIYDSSNSLKIFFNLINKYNISGLRIHDANIVASALDNDIKIIITNNIQDFEIFQEIKVLGMEDFLNE